MGKKITVEDLHAKMTKEKVCLIDVRETAEFKKAYVKGSTNIPLSVIECHPDVFKAENLYIMCNSGGRSKMACDNLAKSGVEHVVNVEGGIREWANKQLPINGAISRSIPIMRQVMIVAGLMILSGIGLYFYIHPKWIFLSAFVGAGLFYAGVSGNCYMTKVLALLPWNK